MAIIPLSFFEDLVFSGRMGKPPKEAVDSLIVLAGLVGSPTYSKTPNFRRDVFANKQWDNFRVFKKTEIVAKPTTEVERATTLVREHLNKLADTNFEATATSVLDVLNSRELSSDDVTSLCKCVCKTGSRSSYYAAMYARITARITQAIPQMKTIVSDHLSGFDASLSELSHVDSSDYDAFCAMNAKKESRKGLGVFMIGLADAGVLDRNVVTTMVKTVHSMIDENKDTDGKQKHVEDLVEMLITFISTACKAELGYTNLGREFVTTLSMMKRQDHPGLSSKAIFACMDYLER
jgi:hypothetical protein